MATNVYSGERINYFRVFGAVTDGGRKILLEAIRNELEKTTTEPWEDGKLLKTWAKENIDFVKKYRFFKSQEKEDFEGIEIPNFDKGGFQHQVDEFVMKTLRSCVSSILYALWVAATFQQEGVRPPTGHF
jgi:hypothetical protein